MPIRYDAHDLILSDDYKQTMDRDYSKNVEAKHKAAIDEIKSDVSASQSVTYSIIINGNKNTEEEELVLDKYKIWKANQG